ncbi:MAG TPA: phage capsid protein [Clostridiales bacterium]|nr:phage capsid protein [Clostridiales bacterium]
MPANIDLFDSYYLTGVVQEIVPQTTFFRDRYFPTNPETDIFAADKVLVEYREGDRRLAPFVQRRQGDHYIAGDIPIGRDGYEVHEYEPPHILPSRLLTLDDLKRRGFGEALYVGSNATERAAALQLRDLRDLDLRITRREEWMAAQTMINNAFTAVALIDDATHGEIFDIYYYNVNETNPAICTVPEKWDDILGNYLADIQSMCEMLESRGMVPEDLVLGSTVGKFLMADEKLHKLLDNKRLNIGKIDPEITSPGTVWLGFININGYKLNIFVSHETYIGDDGVERNYFPAKSAMVTFPGCGHMMYAQITQIEPDNQYHSFAMPRVSKFVAEGKKDIRKIRLASRPLAAPKQKAPWVYAANVLL